MACDWGESVGVDDRGKVEGSGRCEGLGVVDLESVVVGGGQECKRVERVERQVGNTEARRRPGETQQCDTSYLSNGVSHFSTVPVGLCAERL